MYVLESAPKVHVSRHSVPLQLPRMHWARMRSITKLLTLMQTRLVTMGAIDETMLAF